MSVYQVNRSMCELSVTIKDTKSSDSNKGFKVSVRIITSPCTNSSKCKCYIKFYLEHARIKSNRSTGIIFDRSFPYLKEYDEWAIRERIDQYIEEDAYEVMNNIASIKVVFHKLFDIGFKNIKLKEVLDASSYDTNLEIFKELRKSNDCINT